MNLKTFSFSVELLKHPIRAYSFASDTRANKALSSRALCPTCVFFPSLFHPQVYITERNVYIYKKQNILKCIKHG